MSAWTTGVVVGLALEVSEGDGVADGEGMGVMDGSLDAAGEGVGSGDAAGDGLGSGTTAQCTAQHAGVQAHARTWLVQDARTSPSFPSLSYPRAPHAWYSPVPGFGDFDLDGVCAEEHNRHTGGSH